MLKKLQNSHLYRKTIFVQKYLSNTAKTKLLFVILTDHMLFCCKHFSESIHTWSIGTLKGPCRGIWLEIKTQYIFQSIIAMNKFLLDVHVFTNTDQKTFILKPQLPCRFGFRPSTSYFQCPCFRMELVVNILNTLKTNVV